MKNITLLILLITAVTSSYAQDMPSEAKEGWTEEIRQEHIDECIKNAVESYKKNPEQTTKFCECTTDKIIAQMSLKESQDIFASSQEQMLAVIKPLIESCQAEVQKQETAEQLQTSQLAEKDTLVNFENVLELNVPAGLKWTVLDRNGIKSFAINQQMNFGNIIIGVLIFDQVSFKEVKSQMIDFYSNNKEPKYTFSNQSENGCPTKDCANYDLEMLITGIPAKGKMYIFGKDNKYFNAYFVTTGEPEAKDVDQLKSIIEASKLTF
jgi:hypothetical protein